MLQNLSLMSSCTHFFEQCNLWNRMLNDMYVEHNAEWQDEDAEEHMLFDSIYLWL